MPRRIIVNADDFGLLPSVNKAIIEVYQAGNLDSTTLMVNMPGTQDAVNLAKANPGLAVGLHFCLTEGKPLSEAKTLCGTNGEFLDQSALFKKLIRGKVDLAEIKSEFEAQLLLARSLGVDIRHSDSHQHAMFLPKVFEAIAPVLEAEKLAARSVLSPRRRSTGAGKFIRNVFKNRSVAKAKRLKVAPMNDHLVSIHDTVDPLASNEDTYHALINACAQESLVEVMVHPYIDSPELKEHYGESYDRKQPFLAKCIHEHRVLTSKRLFGPYERCNFAELI